MIHQDFLVQTEAGLYCPYGDFYLDPTHPVINAIISHGHGDHAVGGNSNVWCTAPTADIMKLRFKKNAAEQFSVRNFYEEFERNSVKIRFIPAGHIIGSAQVLMYFEGTKYLYTGDYKLQPDKTCEPIKFEQADVLITETTFASRDNKHPDVAQEIVKLNEIRHSILLGAYSLGKAQRLISLINEYCPEREILVHHSVLPLNKLYENHGFAPGKYTPYDRKLIRNGTGKYIYIVPPLTFRSYVKAVNLVRVFASGWKHLHSGNYTDLFISDHADLDDILETIRSVQPQEIWTVHGNGSYLKELFKNKIVVKQLNAGS